MLSEQLILAAFVSSTVFGWVVGVIEFIGGNVYDIRQTKLKRHRLAHPYAKRFRHKPLISVIIPARNEAHSIQRCIKQLFSGSYKKIEVIVVNDASTDNTAKVVRTLMQNYPRRNIRLISKRKHAGKMAAIQDGFKRAAHGELVMVLDADTLVDKNACKAIIESFAEQEFDIGLPNVQVLDHPSILGLMQRIDFIRANQPRKINNLLGSETFIDSRLGGVVYHRKSFIRLIRKQLNSWSSAGGLGSAVVATGNTACRISYLHSALLFTEPITSLTELIVQRSRWQIGNLQIISANVKALFNQKRGKANLSRTCNLPFAAWRQAALLLDGLVGAYFIYLAVELKQPAMYLIVWAAASFIFLFNVWINTQLPSNKRLVLSLYTPLVYNLHLLMVIVDILTLAVVFLDLGSNKSHKPVSWQTPRRLYSEAEA